MLIVIGKEIKEGVFNDVPWRKAYLYCAEDLDPKRGEGQRVEYFKCKPELVSNVEVGDHIEVNYDKYNNVKSVQVF